MDKIKVIVVDKQNFFRIGLCQVLSQGTDMQVLECDPDNDPIKLVEVLLPDVVLLDIDFPSLDGLKLANRIVRNYSGTRVVVLSPGIDSGQLVEIVKSGVAACINKNTSVEELTDIIKRVYGGEYPINDSVLSRPKVAERVLRQFQDMVAAGQASEAMGSPLTDRETQILKLIAEGNSNKQVASALDISE